MVMDDCQFEDDSCMRRDRSRAVARAHEATHVVRQSAAAGPAPPSGEKIPLFWQIFGGTIVGVLALIVVTAFSQLSSTATDLRRDVSQVQSDQIHKDELNVRLNALWTSVKDLQTATASREESAKVLHHDLATLVKTEDDQRKVLQRGLEELSRRVQILGERLAAMEATQRLAEKNGVTGK